MIRIALPMMGLLFLSLAPRAGAQDVGVAVGVDAGGAGSLGSGASTTTLKRIADMQVMSQASDKAAFDQYFDQSGPARGRFSMEVLGAPGAAGKAGAAPAKGGVKPLSLDKPLDSANSDSNTPAAHQCCLNTLQVSPSGNLYREIPDHAWWQFWSSNQAIQEATANGNGNYYNGKGQFIGNWKTVLNTTANQYQVVQGQDSADHIYTFQNANWSSNQQVYRDGKYVTTFAGTSGDASLVRVKAGMNDQVYAQYQKNSEDVIMTVDPGSQRAVVATRVAADVRVWQEWIPPTPPTGHYTDTGYYQNVNGTSIWVDTGQQWVQDSGGTPGYWQTNTTRYGVDNFNVTSKGTVLALQEGNVYAEGQKGQSVQLTGDQGNGNPLSNPQPGNVTDFKTDSYGNLYSVVNGQIVVNNSPTGGGTNVGGGPLNVDDQGFAYQVNGIINQTVTATNINSDPANSDQIANIDFSDSGAGA